jgi:hypothetical protein
MLKDSFPELYSFTKQQQITLQKALHGNLSDLFRTPFSEQTYDQFLQVHNIFQSPNQTNENDQWIYIWGISQFYSIKIYKSARSPKHPQGLWMAMEILLSDEAQSIFWLFLKDRLNTRRSLRRKNMGMESYTCNMCIWQYEKTIQHLFQQCNFAKACKCHFTSYIVATV